MAGIGCVVLALGLFVVAMAVYVTGDESAFFGLIIALAGFVLGIGLLAAARRAGPGR